MWQIIIKLCLVITNIALPQSVVVLCDCFCVVKIIIKHTLLFFGGVIVGLEFFHICETYIYTPYLVYTPNSNTTSCVYLSIHSYIYISIYTCSPVKQKNTEFFQKKAKIRKIPKKNKNGTILSQKPKNQSSFKYFEK